MSIELVRPSPQYEASYNDYIVELGEEERYPFPMDFDHTDFQALLEKLDDFSSGRNVPNGYVPATTYWLVEEGELIGVSNLRHHLNERIRESGGHIGLGIRPSYRGQGLGVRLLELTIEKARELKIEEIHIHCHKSNEASSRMIKSVGASLHSEIAEVGSSEVVQRYVL